jgi:hypothetical protein
MTTASAKRRGIKKERGEMEENEPRATSSAVGYITADP